MSRFQIGQRVQACDDEFKSLLDCYGYSLTGTVVDIVNDHRWPVKVLMDKRPYNPTAYSKDKQIIEFDISFYNNGTYCAENIPVIEVIE